MSNVLGSIALTTAMTMASTCGALAEPPKVGTTHAFVDPVFRGTVFCDTREQVEAIATAAQPDHAYAALLFTANDVGEPTCLAVAPTALVVDVAPLGVMTKGRRDFDSWVIEVDIDGITAFGLYIEARPDIWA